MNIFIIGMSHTRKTTIAKLIAERTGLQYIQASRWAREMFATSGVQTETDQEFIDAITAMSVEALRVNPYACVEYITAHHDLSKPFVIEGIRNPTDFKALYRDGDLVIFLKRTTNDVKMTEFESSGLIGIGRLCDYNLRIIDYLDSVTSERIAAFIIKFIPYS